MSGDGIHYILMVVQHRYGKWMTAMIFNSYVELPVGNHQQSH
jgi:hypothetical protein